MAEQDGTLQAWQMSSGYIDRLEVHNFKSYKGKQQIGPFKSFTAVVGPNGSGKSNLMDAISFVLGVRTQQLRGSLKELLYYNSDGRTEEDKPKRGYVRLVYTTDEGEEVTFARHIQPSSADAPDTTFTSVYKINDRTVSWDAYSQKLSSFGILVKVRNFLVFQGDIEAVAAKSPQGLTALFEQISGSEAFRQQYDELQKGTTKADEKVSIAFSRKKAVVAERKQKKEQSDEAEKYLAKQRDLRALRVEHLLFTLHHLRASRDAAAKEAAQLATKAAKVAKEHEGYEGDLEAIKRRSAAAAKEKLLHEKKVKKLQADRDKKAPDLQRAQEAATRIEKTIRTAEKEIEELSGKLEAGAAKVKQLEKELKSIKTARTKLEAEAKAHGAKYAAGAGAGVGEGGSVHDEFERIKLQVEEKTAKLASELLAADAQLKADRDALQQLLDQQRAYQDKAASLKQQANESGARAAAALEEAQQAKKLLKVKKEERSKCDDQLRQSSSQREYLELELGKVQAQLRDAGSDRKEAKKEQRKTEAVAALKQLYPQGVFGRLTELGKVSRRDYYLALSVAMGRHIDSVVVDSDRTALEAIQYLKDHQVPPMTFIPLATCKVQPVNERLRSGLGGTARLAVDLVEPERPELARAFQFAFENTLVCEGVEEAQQLAFGGAERHKVVAKDGTQFNKSGLITGGDAGSLNTKAGRWDDKLVAQLRTKQEQLGQQIQDLPSISSLREQAAAAAQEVDDLEARGNYKEAEAKASKERYKAASKEAQEAEAAATQLQQQLDDKQAAVERQEAEVQALHQRIHEVGDRLFAPLSQRLGVANIRQYEEEHAAFQADIKKQRQQLDAKEAKVKQQLEFESGKKIQDLIDKKTRLLEEDKAHHERHTAKVAEVQQALAQLSRSVEELQQAIRKADTEVAKAQEDLKALRKRGSSLAGEMTQLARSQAQQESLAKAAEATARDMVAAAEVEGVQLPRTPGAAALQEVADAMEVDDDQDTGQAEASAQDKPSGTSSAHAAGGSGSVLDTLDYSSLPARLTRTMSTKEVDTTTRSLQQAQAELQAELEGMTPNLKATEQFEQVKEKEKELTKVLDEARKESTEAHAAFNKCRQSRFDAFMAAFTHISQEIDTIYRELTRSSVHPLGGTAYLSLEQPEEPYLAGIKYTTMPPTKRFRDMEQLSGGEKTVAALALLFAIHSFRPSPFFVLDEVDAALDATNVARVAHYIRDKTRGARGGGGLAGAEQEQPGFQSIVISLKDIFYEKADALVGVARDVDKGSSTTFTFDLSAFGEPLAADA